MKNDKRKLISLARKTIRKDIRLSLIAKLKEVSANLGQGSKELEKEIEKGSKRLAKKVLKELKVDKSVLLGVSKELIVAKTPEPKKPINMVGKPIPASSSAIKAKPGKPGSKVVAKSKPVKEKSGN